MSSAAPYHAHVYFEAEETAPARALHARLLHARDTGEIPGLSFVGRMMATGVGPHPIPQFEAHFPQSAVPAVRAAIEQSGLRALIHPLTDDDLADHTTLAQWIGAPVTLDLTVLDPPGINQGIDRFGKSDF